MKNHLRAIRSRLFTLRCRSNRIEGSGPYHVDGTWPAVVNRGSFHLGPRSAFRTFRLRTRIDVHAGAALRIGEKAFINDGVNICCSKGITIGDHVKIADWAVLYDTHFHELTPGEGIRSAEIHVGKNVWIGARAVILAGSRIGDHAVIAAGAIVSGEVPARTVAAGIPARVIRTFACGDDWVRP